MNGPASGSRTSSERLENVLRLAEHGTELVGRHPVTTVFRLGRIADDDRPIGLQLDDRAAAVGVAVISAVVQNTIHEHVPF